MMQKFNLNLVFCLKDKEPLYNAETAGCWLDICVVGPCSDQIRYNLNMFGNIIEKLSYRGEMNRARD